MRSSEVRALVAGLVVAVSLAGCAGSSRPRSSPSAERPRRPGTKVETPVAEPAGPPSVRRRLAFARSLLGSRYRFGGETPAGFDCSGFTHYVFDRDGVRLPRTTSEQARAGHWVPLDELRPGDLLFFSEVEGKPHHVGIVVSNPGEPLRMIHASTSQGVVETDVLEGTYWLRRLSFGRRVDPVASGWR